MQPVRRCRCRRPRLLRVRHAGAATGEPGQHVHLCHDRDGRSRRACVRGQLRVRRVHGRLRGRLPAAIGSTLASASIPATALAAAAFTSAVTASTFAASAVAASSTASVAAAVTATAVTTTAISAASAAARSADVRVQHNACGWWRWQYQRHCNYHFHRPACTDAAAAAHASTAVFAGDAAVGPGSAWWLLVTPSSVTIATAVASSSAAAAVAVASPARATLAYSAAALATRATVCAAAAAGARAAGRLLTPSALSATISTATAVGATLAATTATAECSAMLRDCVGQEHRLRRRGRVRDRHDGQRRRGARQVQPTCWDAHPRPL